uniref:DDE-1 domain-containing protein n=1 Tax=Strongyloides venezuelensis TaxID=75913 RepID=A0A0K0FQ08_STRVS
MHTSHPSSELLNRENGKFRVMILPRYVTSTLQPIDQDVIETLKHKKTLERSWINLLEVSQDQLSEDGSDMEIIELTDLAKIIKLCDEYEEIIKLAIKDREEDDEDAEAQKIIDGPSRVEAFQALEMAFQWLERQEETTPM